jgi:hypothetical protein
MAKILNNTLLAPEMLPPFKSYKVTHPHMRQLMHQQKHESAGNVWVTWNGSRDIFLGIEYSPYVFHTNPCEFGNKNLIALREWVWSAKVITKELKACLCPIK